MDSVSTRRHHVIDVVLTLAFAVLLTAPIVHDSASAPRVFLSLALVVPLALARRWPLPVFASMAAIAFLQWLLDRGMPADAALLVALYAVAPAP